MEDEGNDRVPFRKWVVYETAAPRWRMNQIPAERREGAWFSGGDIPHVGYWFQ
jgi:hypothetical protein